MRKSRRKIRRPIGISTNISGCFRENCERKNEPRRFLDSSQIATFLGRDRLGEKPQGPFGSRRIDHDARFVRAIECLEKEFKLGAETLWLRPGHGTNCRGPLEQNLWALRRFCASDRVWYAPAHHLRLTAQPHKPIGPGASFCISYFHREKLGRQVVLII